MAMNVREAFLHHAKDGNFHILIVTAETALYVQGDWNLAPLRKSFNAPLQG
jgi:hypothetical protein